MNFLFPAAFILASLLPVIILLYILKLRRNKRLVSSTFLWQRIVRDIEANTLWQRLRSHLLLFLQLLILTFLIFALARPYNWTEGLSGGHAIIILDTSASMGAVDVQPNRLEFAKKLAHDLIDSMPESARVTIISAGLNAEILTSLSSDRRQLHQTIENISLTMGNSQMSIALELASAVTGSRTDSELIIISDGSENPSVYKFPTSTFRFIPVGNSDENIAINLITLELSPDGKSATSVVQVINYGSSSRKRQVAIYADGDLFNVHEITISSGEDITIIEELLPGTSQSVTAYLLPTDDEEDYLLFDDQATAILHQKAPERVSLVSQGNLFLDTALSLYPQIEVTRIDPSEGIEFVESNLTIFDTSISPTVTLPAGNLLFIGPTYSTEFFDVQGSIQSPSPYPSDQTYPLLAHVSFDQVHILEAARIPLPDWARSVVFTIPHGEDEILPLLFFGQVDNRKIAVIAFDLQHSDFPLLVDFPIFFSNLMEWFLTDRSVIHSTQILPGDTVPILVPKTEIGISKPTQVVVTFPDGSVTHIETESNELMFSETEQIGRYSIDLGEGMRSSFSVNFFLPQESAIKPLSNPLSINALSSDQAPASQKSRSEWWQFLALIALVILMIEWLIYQRPAIAYLSKKIIAFTRR